VDEAASLAATAGARRKECPAVATVKSSSPSSYPADVPKRGDSALGIGITVSRTDLLPASCHVIEILVWRAVPRKPSMGSIGA
jgi:hypothetical protein